MIIVSIPVLECRAPCNNLYYLVLDTNECVQACSELHTPKIIHGIIVCQPRYTEEEKNQAEQIASSVIIGNTMTSYVSYLATASTGLAAGMYGIVASDKFLYYLRYLNVDYPVNVLLYFKQQSSTVNMNYDIPSPQWIEENFAQNKVAQMFLEYELSSSFIFNFWNTFKLCSSFISIQFRDIYIHQNKGRSVIQSHFDPFNPIVRL